MAGIAESGNAGRRIGIHLGEFINEVIAEQRSEARIEVHPASALVLCFRLVVCRRFILGLAGDIGRRNVFKRIDGHRRPCLLWNDAVGKYAIRRRGAAARVVGLARGHRISEPTAQNAGKITPIHSLAAVRGIRTLQRIGLVDQVPCPIRSGRHGEVLCGADNLFCSLIVTEPKHLVAADGAARRPAELVLNENPALGREVVLGVQICIAQKVEGVTVYLVGTGFGHHVDLAATVIAILRIEVVCNDAELGNRVNIRNQRGPVLQFFFRVGAVDHEAVRVGASAVDGEGSHTACCRIFLIRRDARLKGKQIDERSAVQRDGGDLLFLDHLTHLSTLCFHLQGIRTHGDGVGDRAQF